MVTNTSPFNLYIGIDVDKKSFSYTICEDGKQKSKKMPSEPGQFTDFIQNHYPDKKVLCAYEAGATGYNLYDHLKEHNIECLVISPSSLPKPSDQRVKTNRIDSETIVKELKAGNLESIRVPDLPHRQLRHFSAMRDEYVQRCKKIKQRIKSLLLFERLYPYVQDANKNWTRPYIESIKKVPCSETIRFKLDMFIKDHDSTRAQLLILLLQMRKFVKQHPDIEKNIGFLTTIPGIGFVTAFSLVAKIGDPSKMKNVRELGSFVGLTPSEYSTGDNTRRGPITRLGDSLLRKLLVEASWIVIRKDKELEQFYHRIYHRNHPKGAAQKAITAVAHKLTSRIYRVLKDQRAYTVR